jgi:hypothetical protein
MKQSRLRAIPSVDRLLQSLGDTDLPRPIIVDVVRRELKAVRSQRSIPNVDTLLARIRASLRDEQAS